MKEKICTGIGLAGSLAASVFGGWDAALSALVVFMAVDYLSGLVVAGVFHQSSKSASGALESRAGWKGLCKKGMTLLCVLIGHRLDLAIGISYIRDAVIFGFMANELLSIIENAGLMGVPMPAALTKAVELLQEREQVHENINETEFHQE